MVFPSQNEFSHMGEMLAVQKHVCIPFWAGLKLKVSFSPSKVSSLGDCLGWDKAPLKFLVCPHWSGNLVSWIPALCSSCAKMPQCGNKSLGKDKIYLGKKQRPTPGLVALFVKGLGCFLLSFFFFFSLSIFPVALFVGKNPSSQQKETPVWTEPLILNDHIHFQSNYCVVWNGWGDWEVKQRQTREGGRRMLRASPISTLAGGTAVLQKGQVETSLLLKSTLS